MKKQLNSKPNATSHKGKSNGESYHYSHTKSAHGQKTVPAHHLECNEFLKTTKGWKHIFLMQLLSESTINIFQHKKLDTTRNKSQGKQIKCCNYMKTATWPSSKKYFCSECGNWIGFTFAQRIFGGEADA